MTRESPRESCELPGVSYNVCKGLPLVSYMLKLQLRTCCNESLASLVGGILAEVLDEASCKVLCFLLTLCWVSVGIARIKDVGVDIGQGCWNLEVEHRNLLGLSLEDAAVEDGIYDTTCIGYGDTLACTVPSCVDEVSLSSVGNHLLDEFLCVLSGVQFEECLSEASRECRCGLGDAALCTSQLGRESREEVVLCLLGCQDRHGRKYSECVSREEDDVLGCWSRTAWLDVVDVVDGVGDTCVLGNALVVEVDSAVCCNRNVLEECVALDGSVDVGLVLLA